MIKDRKFFNEIQFRITDTYFYMDIYDKPQTNPKAVR